jgi:glycosyltransferase involved in cell wall biosynthesis
MYKEEINNLKPTPFTHILYHGRICREKGIEPLFKALSLIADLPFRITFAGNIDKRDKDLWEHLLSSSKVKDKIEYIGFCTDMRELLNTCHIGISPSIVQEAGPLSIIEDMAYGLAVITSDNGVQPEIIQNGINGILCPSNNPKMIADALTQLLTNPELTERIGKQAQKDFFKQHSYDKFIKEMYQLYRL